MAKAIDLLRSPVLPSGFRAAGIACGIKDKGKLDLGLIVSDHPTACSATFTTNKIKAAPVRLSMRHLKGGKLQAVVVNSGNANACNGKRGEKDARVMAQATARELGLEERQVFVCSTGIIGLPLPVDKIQMAAPALVEGLRPGGLRDFSRAILTSDKRNKVVSARISIGGKN